MKFLWSLSAGVLAGGAAAFGTLMLGAFILMLFPLQGDELLYLISQIEYVSMIVGVAMCGVVFLHINEE